MFLLDQTSQVKGRISNSTLLTGLTALVFVGCIGLVGTLSRDNWPLILLPYGVAFLIYLIIATTKSNIKQLTIWIGVAIVSRVLLLPFFPNLSDDVYRFIWDGHATLQGLSTYEIVPSQFIAENGASGNLTPQLLELLNSPDYYTVYPPLSQLFFKSAAWISGPDWHLNSIVLKSIILLFEIATIGLLSRHFGHETRRHVVLLYALNPLVIIELTGNIHFEAVMIFGTVLAIILLRRVDWFRVRNLGGAAIGLILGIGVKLLPVIFAFFLVRRIAWRRLLLVTVLSTAALLALFMPMTGRQMLTGTGESLGLYFLKFEFNASIYYILRWIGYQVKGYNMIATIGQWTTIATMLIFVLMLMGERRPSRQNWARICLFALSSYLALASIVHPWYICPLVALCCFTPFRYPVWWSALAFLSYSAYSSADYSENLWLVALEYVVVYAIATYELISSSRVDSWSNKNSPR